MGSDARGRCDTWLLRRFSGGHLVLPTSRREQTGAAHGNGFRGPSRQGRCDWGIEISRLGISAVIMEGSDETVLRRGVGHIPGTAFSGRSGNVGLAAHRDSFFRGLRNIRRNDDVVLRTPRGEYRYRVVSTKKVVPKVLCQCSGPEPLQPGTMMMVVSAIPCALCYSCGFRAAAEAEWLCSDNSRSTVEVYSWSSWEQPSSWLRRGR